MGGTGGKPKYSVLIPVRNTEKYIEQCIESVLRQTYQDFEIIIVDNESTDGSEKIIDDYAAKDARIRVFHQENQGLLMSRRRAISEAEGDYLCFLDSDDAWDCGFIEAVDKAIGADDFDMCIFGYKTIDENSKPLGTDSGYYLEGQYEGDALEELWYKIVENPVLNNMWLKVIRRSCFSKETDAEYKALGQVNGTEGAIQTLEVLRNAKKVACIPNEQIYMYRIRKTSVVHTVGLRYYEECKLSDRYFKAFIEEMCGDTKRFFDKRLINVRFAVFCVVCNIANSSVSYAEKKALLLSIINDELFCFAVQGINFPKNMREGLLWALKRKLYLLVIVFARIRKIMEAIS